MPGGTCLRCRGVRSAGLRGLGLRGLPGSLTSPLGSFRDTLVSEGKYFFYKYDSHLRITTEKEIEQLFQNVER